MRLFVLFSRAVIRQQVVIDVDELILSRFVINFCQEKKKWKFLFFF